MLARKWNINLWRTYLTFERVERYYQIKIIQHLLGENACLMTTIFKCSNPAGDCKLCFDWFNWTFLSSEWGLGPWSYFRFCKKVKYFSDKFLPKIDVQQIVFILETLVLCTFVHSKYQQLENTCWQEHTFSVFM